MQVDHLIPEHLQSQPVRLAEVIKDLALPGDFELNSYENWLPSCGPCNNTKRNDVYRPSPLYLSLLSRAERKADDCRALELSWKTEKKIANALGYLEAAAEEDRLDYGLLQPLIASWVEANPKLLREMIEAAESTSDKTTLSFIQTTTFAISPRLSVVFGGGEARIVPR